jgi:Putative cyclase
LGSRGRVAALRVPEGGAVLQRRHARGHPWGEQVHRQRHPGYESTTRLLHRKLTATAWAAKGIVGRGILVDLPRWLALPENHAAAATYDPLRRTAVSLSQLRQALASQGTEPRFGDVLIVRTGYPRALARAAEGGDKMQDAMARGMVGVDANVDVARWIWENFAAVAGDQPAFECARECFFVFSVDVILFFGVTNCFSRSFDREMANVAHSVPGYGCAADGVAARDPAVRVGMSHRRTV